MNTLRFSVLCLLFTGAAAAALLLMSLHSEAAFFEKQYVVERDQGKDVLCDQYVVQEGDWIFKLLRQRGDIAYSDFPRFVRIFKRLNPHIKDVDLIYPGQHILVPLRILEPNTLEGQASGTVSIPLITITNLPETIKAHSVVYTVKYGDWISKLISERFGPVGSKSYERGLDLFMRMNPDIKNIDRISVGQEIRLPDPAIRNHPWYPQMIAESGNGEAEAQAPKEKPEPEGAGPDVEEPETAPVPVAVKVVPEAAQRPVPEPQLAAEPLPEPPAKPESIEPLEPEAKADPGADETEPPMPVEPVAAPVAEADQAAETGEEASPKPQVQRFLDNSVFGKAARILNADLLDRGQYFFPRKRRSDLMLDLSDTPVIEFKNGRRLLFTRPQWLPPGDQMVIQDHWKALEVVMLEGAPGLLGLLERIIPIIDADGYENRMIFNDRGVSVVVRSRFIYNSPGENARICLNIISDPAMGIPQPVCDYLAQQGLIVRDWVEAGDMSGWIVRQSDATLSIAPLQRIEAGDPAQFVRQIADVFGYRYQQNVDVSFPYAGFQVKATANMLSFGNQSEVLIDYGSMQGDALRAIEETGFKIAQITPGSDEDAVIRTLSQVSPIGHAVDPVFWTARRPRIYNPSIQVPGYFLTAESGGQKREVLLSRVPIPDALKQYFSSIGIRMLRIY